MKAKLVYYPEYEEDSVYVTIGNIYEVEFYKHYSDYCEIYDDDGELHGVDSSWVEIVGVGDYEN